MSACTSVDRTGRPSHCFCRRSTGPVDRYPVLLFSEAAEFWISFFSSSTSSTTSSPYRNDSDQASTLLMTRMQVRSIQKLITYEVACKDCKFLQNLQSLPDQALLFESKFERWHLFTNSTSWYHQSAWQNLDCNRNTIDKSHKRDQ